MSAWPGADLVGNRTGRYRLRVPADSASTKGPLRALAFKILSAVTLAGAVIIMAASFAGAAGTSYQGTSGPAGAAGLFQSVVTTETVSTLGGAVSGAIDHSTVTVTVPTGDLLAPQEVTITTGDPSAIGDAGVRGAAAVLTLGITVTDPTTGDKFTGTFASPLTVTIRGSFNPADTVVVYDPTGSAWHPLSGATITTSRISFTIASDPDVAVLTSADKPAVVPPGGGGGADTRVTSGVPLRLEETLGAALFALGLLGVYQLRRSRTRSVGLG